MYVRVCVSAGVAQVSETGDDRGLDWTGMDQTG